MPRLAWLLVRQACVVLASRFPRRELPFASLVPPKSSSCVDTQAQCATWAAAGECEKNPDFMLTGCADSCTRCKEGPDGEGRMRTQADRNRRKDRWCGDHDDDCKARAEAGDCHNGTDAPLRCPGSCRICSFPVVAQEAYGCDSGHMSLTQKLFPSMSERSCVRKRKRCARPPDTPPAVGPGGIGETMRRILSDFPQYTPRAISQPGGPHGEHAPWVVTLQVHLATARDLKPCVT